MAEGNSSVETATRKEHISLFRLFLYATTLVLPTVIITLVLMEVFAPLLANYISDIGRWARYLAWIVGIGSTFYPIAWCLAIYPRLRAM